jgi:hypothetical protein
LQLSGRELANVFVPEFRARLDKVGEEVSAFLVVEIQYFDAMFAEPVEAAWEVAAFAYDEGADVELADQAATVPAWGERGDHDQVAVVGLTAGATEGVRFAVDGGVALLDAPVVAAAEERSVPMKERGADGNAAFSEAKVGFFKGDGEHVLG